MDRKQTGLEIYWTDPSANLRADLFMPRIRINASILHPPAQMLDAFLLAQKF